MNTRPMYCLTCSGPTGEFLRWEEGQPQPAPEVRYCGNCTDVPEPWSLRRQGSGEEGPEPTTVAGCPHCGNNEFRAQASAYENYRGEIDDGGTLNMRYTDMVHGEEYPDDVQCSACYHTIIVGDGELDIEFS